MAAMVGGLRELWRHRGLARSRLEDLVQGRRPIAYMGWEGHGNLGDDAMFQALQRMLGRRRLTGAHAPRVEDAMATVGLSGTTYYSSAVLGGGTLIQPFMLAATSDLLRRGLPMWSVGTGVGSCGWDQPEEIGLDGWADVLQRFVRIGVRGPISESRLRAMGIQRAEVVGDLALALALPRPWVPARVRVLGVNFVSRGTAARTEGNMRRLVRWAVDDGWEVRGFGMDPEDVAPTTALLQSAGMAGNVPLLRTFEQYCGYVGGCHMVSSVRLHGAILACCAGVPPLLVGYRDKCRDFMESMQIGEWLLAWDGAPDQWMHTARDLADRCLGERQGLVERANHWRAVLERFVSETAKQV